MTSRRAAMGVLVTKPLLAMRPHERCVVVAPSQVEGRADFAGGWGGAHGGVGAKRTLAMSGWPCRPPSSRARETFASPLGPRRPLPFPLEAGRRRSFANNLCDKAADPGSTRP
jgi:hypothetical protein